MATAKKEVRTTEVVQLVTSDVIVLELSEEEAKVLKAAMLRVHGEPDSSYRSVTSRIYNALNRAGLPWIDDDDYFISYLTGKAMN